MSISSNSCLPITEEEEDATISLFKHPSIMAAKENVKNPSLLSIVDRTVPKNRQRVRLAPIIEKQVSADEKQHEEVFRMENSNVLDFEYSWFSMDDRFESSIKGLASMIGGVQKMQSAPVGPATQSIPWDIMEYYKSERFKLQRIQDGNFNDGGVQLQIDFDKKLIKAVKQVPKEHVRFFQKEIRALNEFRTIKSANKPSDLDEVALRMLDFDEQNHIFSQKAGFINFKQLHSLLQAKQLHAKYRLELEFFVVKQLYFLLRKLHTMHTVHRIAHSDIKPNNIVLGFDFLPYFIDFGGSINLDKEISEYMTVFTPAFIHSKYILFEPKTREEVMSCDNMSLILSFLLILCRSKEENQLFFSRDYPTLLRSISSFYSEPLVAFFTKILPLDQTVQQQQMLPFKQTKTSFPFSAYLPYLKTILDTSILEHIQNISQISSFLRQLKPFEYSRYTNTYTLHEWNEFNANIFKHFPQLHFHLDLQSATPTSRAFFDSITVPNINLTINPLSSSYVDILNLAFTKYTISNNANNNISTIPIESLTVNINLSQEFQQSYPLSQLIKQDNSISSIEATIILKPSDAFPTINLIPISHSLKSLTIKSTSFASPFNIRSVLPASASLRSLCINILDIFLPTLEQVLSTQNSLEILELYIEEYSYKISLPKNLSSLTSLKTNLTIANIKEVVAANMSSLQTLFISINACDESLDLYQLLQSNQSTITTLSLHIQSYKHLASRQPPSINNAFSKTRHSPVLATNFYMSIANLTSRISSLSLDFSDCDSFNQEDISLLLKSIRSFNATQAAATAAFTQQQQQTPSVSSEESQQQQQQQLTMNLLPQTSLSLNLKLKSRTLDDLSTKNILLCLLSTTCRIPHIHLAISTIKVPPQLSTNTSEQKPSFFANLFTCAALAIKNPYINSLSIDLTNIPNDFPFQALVNHLPKCSTFKIALTNPTKQKPLLESLNSLIFTNDSTDLTINNLSNSNIASSTFSNPQIVIQDQFSNETTYKIPIDISIPLDTGIIPLQSSPSSQSQSYPQAPQISDYIDFNPRKFFCINQVGQFQQPMSLTSQASMSLLGLFGLLDSLKVNEQLTNLFIDFSTFQSTSNKQLFQHFFESIKYNTHLISVHVKFIASQLLSPLKGVNSCLSFNETLTSLHLDLSNCSLQPEDLNDISTGITTNEHMTQYTFDFSDNPRLANATKFFAGIQSMKQNTDITVIIDSVIDYNEVLLEIDSGKQQLQEVHFIHMTGEEMRVQMSKYTKKNLDGNLKDNEPFQDQVSVQTGPIVSASVGLASFRQLKVTTSTQDLSIFSKPGGVGGTRQLKSSRSSRSGGMTHRKNHAIIIDSSTMTSPVTPSAVVARDKPRCPMVYVKNSNKLRLIMLDVREVTCFNELLLSHRNTCIQNIRVHVPKAQWVQGLSEALKQSVSINKLVVVFAPSSLSSPTEIEYLLDLLSVTAGKLSSLSITARQSRIGVAGLKGIAQMIQQHSLLKELRIDLSQNMLQPAAGNIIANMLINLPTLMKVSLNLNKNFIAQQGFTPICKVLAENKGLKEFKFKVENNYIHQTALGYLSTAVSENTNLAVLLVYVKGNQIKTEVITEIKALFENHVSLKRFEIKFDSS